jgi:hypothetical protein
MTGRLLEALRMVPPPLWRHLLLLARKSREPLSTFLLEDNFIVSLDADEMLKALGASEVHVASSEAGATQLIEQPVIRFAMLDINLGVETSDAVARRLKALGIAFVPTSGYGERPAQFA